MRAMLTSVVAQVSMTPDFSSLPIAEPIQTLINTLGAIAMSLSVVGIIVGGGLWGVGSLSSNHHAATIGKRATLLSLAGAAVVAASPALVNWAFSVGSSAG